MLFRFLISVVVLYLLYKVIKGILPSLKKKDNISHQPSEIMEDLMEDPCCHAYVPKSSSYETVINGKKTYFCSRDCYLKFKEMNNC
jgi:YHS domain-containing protein